MDGFKDSTRTHYMKGGSADCYAKGGKVKGAAKISKVMGEFKSGKLHSGSKKGPEVTNPKQAVAIALSEARKAGARIPVKKGGGGVISSRPTEEEVRQSRRQDEQLRRVEVSPREGRVLQSAERTTKLENETKMPRKAMGGLMAAPGATPTAKPAPVEVSRPRGVPVMASKPMITNTTGNMARAVPAPVRGPVRRLKGGGLAVMPRGKKC